MKNKTFQFAILCALLITTCGSRETSPDIPSTRIENKQTIMLETLISYENPKLIASIDKGDHSETSLASGDFNGDGLDDVLITKYTFQSKKTYEVEILINNGNGGLEKATKQRFSKTIPLVQNPRQIIVADFNNDGIDDAFIADHGYDLPPYPGFQNSLILSLNKSESMDATKNLPKQFDFTHSACVADFDKDGDIDLYVGNIGGKDQINPQFLINDGKGNFSKSKKTFPKILDLTQNSFTTCEFVDVNNDGNMDLILGDDGSDQKNTLSSRDSLILLNDGTGKFSPSEKKFPAKENPTDIAHDIAPVDINSDGFMDLVLVYERQPNKGSYLQILINNKDGSFRDETNLRIKKIDRLVWIPELYLFDMNHDKKLDILAIPFDYRSPNPIVNLNDGSGHFSSKSIDFKLPMLYFTFLDMDGDGGLDIIYWQDDNIYLIKAK